MGSFIDNSEYSGVIVPVVTLFIVALTLVLVHHINIEVKAAATNMRGVWRSFHVAMKRLLISDVIIRMCEGMTGVLTILYVTNVHGLSTARYGTLIAIQMTTSILVYIPAGKVADRVGRKPFVMMTFVVLLYSPWRLSALGALLFWWWLLSSAVCAKSVNPRARR